MYGRLDNLEVDELLMPHEDLDLPSDFTPFGSSWETHSPLRNLMVGSVIASSMGDLSSSASSSSIARGSNSSGGWALQSDDHHPLLIQQQQPILQHGSKEDEFMVEKSQILEQLRLAAAEVEGLEAQLAAAKRKRARTVSAALEKHKKKQQTEANEMKAVLGSIQQRSLAKVAEKQVRSSSNTLSMPALTNLSLGILQRLQSFTNIHFTSIHNYIVTAKTTGGCVRQYNISGQCYHLDFKLEFTVHEPALTVESLQIEIPASAQSELGVFISEQDLMRKLSQKFPKRTMAASRKKGRNATSSGLSGLSRQQAGLPPTFTAGAPGVQVLVFGGHKKSSPELVFHWVMDVTVDGKIIPHVNMFPRMPKSWRQVDNKATLDAIPAQFLLLVQLKGIEDAVSILVECVFGRQPRTEPLDDGSDHEPDPAE
ncbi:hypothetical protein BG004_007599 [Podila humilis]|nr:hypothetical protein BG004_007599 [Podila humilis]